MAKPNLTTEVYADRAGLYRWRVIARNGQTVCSSGESFASKGNASRAVKAFVRGIVKMANM